MSFHECFARVKAVLFDCDGTLIDSEYIHYLGWKRALVKFGSDLALDEYFFYVGKSAETIAALFAEKIGFDCQAELLTIKRESYPELCTAGVSAIEPTLYLLKQLAANKENRGIQIGICSAASRATLLSHLRHLGIEELCDIILSGKEDLSDYSDPAGTNKPKPYIYQHAMELLGVSPRETIVIEDSAPGVTAGVAAGCFTIAVPNSYTRYQDLSHAHLRLESLVDLSLDQFLKLPQGKIIRPGITLTE